MCGVFVWIMYALECKIQTSLFLIIIIKKIVAVCASYLVRYGASRSILESIILSCVCVFFLVEFSRQHSYFIVCCSSSCCCFLYYWLIDLSRVCGSIYMYKYIAHDHHHPPNSCKHAYKYFLFITHSSSSFKPL